jgi:glutaconate CoA-transferase, subunit B
MGIFSFDPESGEMVLSSHHRGVTTQQIKNETSWRLKIAENVSETSPPTDMELAAVRKYDPKKVWTS